MVYYQKITITISGARCMENTTYEKQKQECPYCSGKGYFQLVLGGSETCSCCSGTGKNQQ